MALDWVCCNRHVDYSRLNPRELFQETFKAEGKSMKDRCLYCPQGLHEMCSETGICCCSSRVESLPVVAEPHELKDILSTGRKRAARMYPIEEGQRCEWAWKKNCGGGIIPIMGCSGRLAEHIHHGPDKSTVNNERDNISIICSFCHNKWHADNDKFYPGKRPTDESPWLPVGAVVHALSEMEDASIEEIVVWEKTQGRDIDIKDFIL